MVIIAHPAQFHSPFQYIIALTSCCCGASDQDADGVRSVEHST
jgi:hypothetical protein